MLLVLMIFEWIKVSSNLIYFLLYIWYAAYQMSFCARGEREIEGVVGVDGIVDSADSVWLSVNLDKILDEYPIDEFSSMIGRLMAWLTSLNRHIPFSRNPIGIGIIKHIAIKSELKLLSQFRYAMYQNVCKITVLSLYKSRNIFVCRMFE